MVSYDNPSRPASLGIKVLAVFFVVVAFGGLAQYTGLLNFAVALLSIPTAYLLWNNDVRGGIGAIGLLVVEAAPSIFGVASGDTAGLITIGISAVLAWYVWTAMNLRSRVSAAS